MAKKTAQPTPAVVALRRAGVSYTLHPYDHDASVRAYGMEAADALGVSPERIFKTLLGQSEDGLCVAVVPVSATLDLKALAAELGHKRIRMADPADAERATGYVVGGISPLGGRRRLSTVVDESALRHPTLYVSAGRRGLQVELAPSDLIRLTDARTSRVAAAP
ncbi:Cys-tRNA(Pro) deacylase [Actinopolymorpha sp. B17G11]|uniref:Cys-tRNA(Pro) deacylase n=1 Tax=unclassified Actinopolymorpha TaxID=2627063 RepID=UPI0032D8D9EE